jgi:hypothetical protein
MMKHRGYVLSLALIAVIGLIAPEARSETITMTISLGGGATHVVVNSAADPSKGFTVSTAELAVINGFLTTNGSQYQFGATSTATSVLGGSSNFPGTASQGNLVLTGELHSIPGGGADAVLKITETESGFTAPTGSLGTLTSSTVGNFTNELNTSKGETVTSMFNATSTPSYTVLSDGGVTNPGVNGGPKSVPISPVSTLYTLANVVTFNLSHAAGTSDVIASFGISAVIATVPEPASMVVFLTGMPLPLAVVFGLMRRRRGLAAR